MSLLCSFPLNKNISFSNSTYIFPFSSSFFLIFSSIILASSNLTFISIKTFFVSSGLMESWMLSFILLNYSLRCLFFFLSFFRSHKVLINSPSRFTSLLLLHSYLHYFQYFLQMPWITLFLIHCHYHLHQRMNYLL